jgi:RNA polymerase sigma factor (sigma-70 family)
MTQDLPATLRVRLDNVLAEHGTTYELERDRVRRVITKYAHGLSETELEDRVSATFLALLRELDSGKGVRKLENYLVAVAHNQARQVIAALVSERKRLRPLEEAEGHGGDPPEAPRLRWKIWFLRGLLEETRPECVRPFDMRLQGFNQFQIAKALGTTREVVAQRWHRCCLKISEICGQGGESLSALAELFA